MLVFLLLQYRLNLLLFGRLHRPRLSCWQPAACCYQGSFVSFVPAVLVLLSFHQLYAVDVCTTFQQKIVYYIENPNPILTVWSFLCSGEYRCWRRNMLVATFECWCQIWPFRHQHSINFSVKHQHLKIDTKILVNLSQ